MNLKANDPTILNLMSIRDSKTLANGYLAQHIETSVQLNIHYVAIVLLVGTCMAHYVAISILILLHGSGHPEKIACFR